MSPVATTRSKEFLHQPRWREGRRCNSSTATSLWKGLEGLMFRRFKGFRRKPHLFLQTRPHWLGNSWAGADPDSVPGALGLSLSENPGREIAAALSSALLAPLGLFSWQRCRQSTGNGPISHCQSPPVKGLQGQQILAQEKARLPQLLGQKFL